MKEYLKTSMYIMGSFIYIVLLLVFSPLIFIISIGIIISLLLYWILAFFCYLFDVELIIGKLVLYLWILSIINIFILFNADIFLFVALILLLNQIIFTITSLVVWRLDVYFPKFLDEDIKR